MNILLRSFVKKKIVYFLFIQFLLFACCSYGQSTCTNITANACTGANISQDFTLNNGAFSSASFIYSATDGWWQLTGVVSGGSYAITSAVYQLNANNVAKIGFSIDKKGGGACGVGSSVSIAITDYTTGAILAQCNASIVSDQVCTNISSASIVAGAKVKFVMTFKTSGFCGASAKFAFDNFSVDASATVVPVPVKLTSFTGSRKNNTVNLTWQTASEFNNKGFEIQRKLQGEAGFEQVGFVNAQHADGNSNDELNYEFKDLNISDQPSQYQLKQVDFDGKYDFSHVVIVPASRSDERLVVYPNPSGDGRVNILFSSLGQRNIQLADINGRIQQTWSRYTSGQLPLKQLKPGIYLLRVKDLVNNEGSIKKIVVL